MKFLLKAFVAILFIIVILFLVLSLYLEFRTKEYDSFYQDVNATEKWETDTGLKRIYVDEQPPKHIILGGELFLLVQSLDYITVAHTDPWTKEKINKHLPEHVRNTYLSNLSSDSWLHKEKPRPTLDVNLSTEKPESID